MSTHNTVKSEESLPVKHPAAGGPGTRLLGSSRSRDSRRQAPADPQLLRLDSSRAASVRPRRSSPQTAFHRSSPDRRRAKSRSVSPSSTSRRGRGRPVFNYERGERYDSRDVNRGRSRGFHFGKNHLQNRPYFKHVRGRGSQYLSNNHPGRGGPPRRQALLETPVGRYTNSHSRGYTRGFRGSRHRSESQRSSVVNNHRDGEFLETFSATSPTPRRSETTGNLQESFCDTASQSSGSVNYNFSHKRSLEMVRDCSPVSDEDEESSPKRTRDRFDSALARPDSTVCDMDIVQSEEEESTTRLAVPRKSQLPSDFFLPVKIPARKQEIFKKAPPIFLPKIASKVEELIDQAWEIESFPFEVPDTSIWESSQLTSSQRTTTDASSSQKCEQPLVFGMRKRSNSCPQPDLVSSPREKDLYTDFRHGKSHCFKGVPERPNLDLQKSEMSGEGEVAVQPMSFADLMSFLPSCQAMSDIDLSAYRPPLFLSKISWLDPLRAMRKVLRKTSNSKQSDVGAFFDTLHTVENPDLPYAVGSLAFTALFKKLHDNLDFAIGHAAWFRTTDSPDEQLGVHFLHAVKMCLLEQLRDFPSVSQPDRSVTRLALEMLLQALIHVDGLADCTAQMGITTDLSDIVFSTIVSLHCRKLTCCILEIFLLRVSHHHSVNSLAELLRKNGTVLLLDVKGPMQRVQSLLDLRDAIEAARARPARPLADLSLRDPTLLATLQEARQEASAQILQTLMDKIVSYREISDKGSTKIDCHAAIYVCLKNARFMDWFLEVLRQISMQKSAENLRKSPLLSLSATFLKLLLEDEYGPLFLADRSSHLGDIVGVLHKIATISSQEKVTELLDRIVFSLEIRHTIDLIGSKQAPCTADGYLAALLLRTNCSQTSGSFFNTPASFNSISRAVEVGGKSFPKIIFSLIFSQYEHPGILSLVDSNPDCCAILDKLDLPLWRSIHRISTEAKNMESSVLLFEGLCAELEKVTARKRLSSSFLATVHIILDTFVYLCANEWFRNILRNHSSDVFLKVHRLVVEHFKEVVSLASTAIDCLDNLLWESVWVNSVRTLNLFMQYSRRRGIRENATLSGTTTTTGVGSSRNLENTSQLSGTFLEMISDMTVLHDANVPLRPKTRAVIQAEIGRSCILLAEEVLDVDLDQVLLATPFYGLFRSFLDAAVCSDAEISAVIAYCALVNVTYPAVWTLARNKKNIKHEDRLSRGKNWESLNKLDHNQLEKIISVGLCCTVSGSDAEFRLWFWRYCEMSDNCLNQGVSLLLLVICGAVSEEMDGDILAVMLQKLASFLRIPLLRRAAVALMDEEENDTGWRPELFDSIIQLVATGSVYTEKQRRIFLLPVARILTRLLDTVQSDCKGSARGFKIEEIAAAVICRLQRDASVPSIYCLWPILEQFFRTDHGTSAFLSQSASHPVLNWILIGIAHDLCSDPDVASHLTLAKTVVAGFLKLSQNPPGTRSVSTDDLRRWANMVVAHTRNCDPYNPSYRIPQNRDPDAILSAHFRESADGIVHSIPETVAAFQLILQKMLLDFSKSDEPDRKYFQWRGDRLTVGKTTQTPPGTLTQASPGMLAKQRYAGKCLTSLTGDETDELHGQWQEKEVQFHLFIERCTEAVDGRYIVDGEMVARKELEEWLRRKIGRF